MSKVRWMAGTAVLFAVLAVASGAASSLADGSRSLATNKAAVSSCDPGGVSTLLNNSAVSPYPIASVTVSGIASACAGQTLRVTVTNSTTSSSGSVAVPAGGGSVTVTLPASITETDAMRTDISMA